MGQFFHAWQEDDNTFVEYSHYSAEPKSCGGLEALIELEWDEIGWKVFRLTPLGDWSPYSTDAEYEVVELDTGLEYDDDWEAFIDEAVRKAHSMPKTSPPMRAQPRQKPTPDDSGFMHRPKDSDGNK